jgi:hypothetical protein
MDTVDPDAPLHKQPCSQRTVKLSGVLDERLDALVTLVNKDASLVGRLYRHDLISALIARAPETAEDLERLVTEYADMTVRDALIGDAKNAKVIELRPAKPGRRTL